MVKFTKYNKTKIDRSYSKHRLRGTERMCVILYTPVTVPLFHRGNFEANMAQIPLLNPHKRRFSFRDAYLLRLAIFTVPVRTNWKLS